MQNVRRDPTPNESHLLFSEVDGLCPLCSKSIMVSKNGKQTKLFEAAHIYPLNPTIEEMILLSDEKRLSDDVNSLDNFIALCRDCHKKFDSGRTVEEYRKVYKIKKTLLARKNLKGLFFDYQIETEIKAVLLALLQESNDSDLTPLKNEALKLDDKADTTLTPFTKRKIRNDITEYYIYIREQFKQLDTQFPKTFKTVASQVNTFYTKISRTEESQEEIYKILTEWLYKKTDSSSSEEACAIIISFFIQNCEVFDDSSKQSC